MIATLKVAKSPHCGMDLVDLFDTEKCGIWSTSHDAAGETGTKREATENMASRKDFETLKREVAASGRCPKAVLHPPEHGGIIATISGEVASRQDLE